MRGQGSEPCLNRAVDHGAAYGDFDRSLMVDRLRESIMVELQRLEAAALAGRLLASTRRSVPMSRCRGLATVAPPRLRAGRAQIGRCAGLEGRLGNAASVHLTVGTLLSAAPATMAPAPASFQSRENASVRDAHRRRHGNA